MFGKLQLVFGDRIYSLETEIRFVALGRHWFPVRTRRVGGDELHSRRVQRNGFEAHRVLYS